MQMKNFRRHFKWVCTILCNLMTSFLTPSYISAFIIAKTKYLLLRRSSAYLTGTWQMVTGGIHEGEKAYEAAIREILEETGLTPKSLYSADAMETFYMKAIDKVMSVPVFVAFIEEEVEVALSPKEHDAYEWLDFQQARERLLFSEQRRVIAIVHENFVLKTPDDFFLINTGKEVTREQF